MNYGKQQEVVAALHRLQRKQCVYSAATRRCDCKFGYGTVDGSEVSGCPEIRTAERLLALLDRHEWKALVERAQRFDEMDAASVAAVRAATHGVGPEPKRAKRGTRTR